MYGLDQLCPICGTLSTFAVGKIGRLLCKYKIFGQNEKMAFRLETCFQSGNIILLNQCADLCVEHDIVQNKYLGQ